MCSCQRMEVVSVIASQCSVNALRGSIWTWDHFRLLLVMESIISSVVHGIIWQRISQSSFFFSVILPLSTYQDLQRRQPQRIVLIAGSSQRPHTLKVKHLYYSSMSITRSMAKNCGARSINPGSRPHISRVYSPHPYSLHC